MASPVATSTARMSRGVVKISLFWPTPSKWTTSTGASLFHSNRPVSGSRHRMRSQSAGAASSRPAAKTHGARSPQGFVLQLLVFPARVADGPGTPPRCRLQSDDGSRVGAINHVGTGKRQHVVLITLFPLFDIPCVAYRHGPGPARVPVSAS